MRVELDQTGGIAFWVALAGRRLRLKVTFSDHPSRLPLVVDVARVVDVIAGGACVIPIDVELYQCIKRIITDGRATGLGRRKCNIHGELVISLIPSCCIEGRHVDCIELDNLLL